MGQLAIQTVGSSKHAVQKEEDQTEKVIINQSRVEMDNERRWIDMQGLKVYIVVFALKISAFSYNDLLLILVNSYDIKN